jgi:hypothetical protein
VVVVRGARDPFVTAELVDDHVLPRFADVTGVTVDGAGHWPHLERPDAVAAVVDDLVARVASASRATTAEGVGDQGWTGAFAQRSASAFTAGFAPEVVLRASVLRSPVEGRDAVGSVMAAASGIYTSLVFTHEARQGDRTYLEWDATLHDGTPVSGVTRLVADAQGRTVDVAIHHRPLDAALAFSDELGRRLGDGADGVGRDHFHRA